MSSACKLLRTDRPGCRAHQADTRVATSAQAAGELAADLDPPVGGQGAGCQGLQAGDMPQGQQSRGVVYIGGPVTCCAQSAAFCPVAVALPVSAVCNAADQHKAGPRPWLQALTCASVFITYISTPVSWLASMRLTAFEPPPPTPTTCMHAAAATLGSAARCITRAWRLWLLAGPAACLDLGFASHRLGLHGRPAGPAGWQPQGAALTACLAPDL